MRALLLAFTLTALGAAQVGAAQPGAAQVLALPDNQVAPMGWAANDSAYAVAVREIDSAFLNGTYAQPEFTPQALSSEIGENLESRLNASLERQLAQKERKTETQVGAN